MNTVNMKLCMDVNYGGNVKRSGPTRQNYTIYLSLAAQTYGVCNCMGLIKFQEELYRMTL